MSTDRDDPYGEPDITDQSADHLYQRRASYPAPELDGDTRPVNWLSLNAEDAEAEFLDLNRWVDWLRHAYGLPPTVVPPLWHRHDELIWELSALHTHWLNSYHPDASPSAPSAWHRDFADTRLRLREWVATCGTRLDRDRPTRQTAWPGEPPMQPAPESIIANRDEDFFAFLIDDANSRRHGGDDADDACPSRDP
ncbi:MAG: hypothetical protein ACTHOK_01305 [Nocardioidaceae bacterium]